MLAATGPGAQARADAQAARWGWSAGGDRAALVGSPDGVAEQLAAWTAAGAGAVVLQPTSDEPDPEAFVTFAAAVGRAATATP